MLTFTIANTDLVWRDQGYTPGLGSFSSGFLKDAEPSPDAVRFTARLSDLDRIAAGVTLKKDPFYRILAWEGQRYYLYRSPSGQDSFAVPYDSLGRGPETEFVFTPGILARPWLTFDWFLGVCGLHKLLLEREVGIFHAAYIEYKGQAILFAAPSGTGKSTQAELWAKFAGARVINGDRVAIGAKNGRFYAYGFPACGSSGICVNQTLPIRAIVVLEQGEKNLVSPLTPAQQYRACLGGMVINTWEAEETAQAMELAQRWMTGIPMCRLTCRPDGEAVSTLQAYLEEIL